MADTFGAIAADAIADILDEMGVSATYTPSGGSPASITCFLDPRIEEELSTFERPVYEKQFEVIFDLAETPNLGKDDTVLIGATTYVVTEITATDGYSSTANVKAQ